jgi:cytochrome c553
MKTFLLVLLSLASVGVVVQEKASKVQPKEVTLSKDSQSDKYGEVPFNHENHALKKYSADGQSVLTCVECHHTDQPAASLKAPLKTSEREVVLTAELLSAADAKPVKSCRFSRVMTVPRCRRFNTLTSPRLPN